MTGTPEGQPGDGTAASVSAVLGATLGGAFLNVAASAGVQAAGLATPRLLLAVTALSATLLFPLSVGAWLAVRTAFRKRPGADAAPLLAVLLAILAAAGVLPAVNWAPWHHPLLSLVSAAAIAMALKLAFGFAHNRPHGGLPGFGLGIAAWGAATLAIAWWTAIVAADAGVVARALGWLVYLAGTAALLLLVVLRPPPARTVGALLALVLGLLLVAASLAHLGPRSPAPQAQSGPWPTERPRHVVLLSVDTLRTDALGAQEAGGPRTPQLDGLLADSIVFPEARSSSPWTKASVASFLTGTSPWVHQTLQPASTIPEQLETLAEGMQEAGYDTAAIEFNPNLSGAFGFDRGFASYRAFPLAPIGNSLGAKLMGAMGYRTQPTSHELTDMAVAWVEEHAERPFFLWLHYLDPHMPYEPPAGFRPDGEAPPGMGPRFGFGDLFSVRKGRQLSPEQRLWVRGLYDGEVRYVDSEAGRFLETLKRLGIYDDALIVFTSDHGEEFWEHGGFEHGHSFYDELLRVPLAFKLPGQSATGTNDTVVSNASIPATVRDLLDLPDGGAPRDTTSLAPLWNAPERPEPGDPVFSIGTVYFDDGAAVVFDGMKYIERFESDRQQLFDLEADARELESRTRADAATATRARALLQRHRTESEAERQRLQIDEAPTVTIDPALREHLKGLGYIQ